MRLVFLAILLTACTSDGEPTGAQCPPAMADQPTYDAFARSFMTTYCTGCHSVMVTNRYDAPLDLNFDTEANLKSHADEIELEAAAGPKATNTSMPDLGGPVHEQPSATERWTLGQYLACQRQ